MDLDLDVDAGRQIEALQRIDRLGRRVDDVDEPLVHAHLEVLAAVFVLEGTADDAEPMTIGGQRHRPANLRVGAQHGLDDLLRRLIDDLVVVRPQTHPNSLTGGHTYFTIFVTVPAPTVRPPSRMANRRPSSMAIGLINCTFMMVLSPGMHISAPSSRVMLPVMSVVRK